MFFRLPIETGVNFSVVCHAENVLSDASIEFGIDVLKLMFLKSDTTFHIIKGQAFNGIGKYTRFLVLVNYSFYLYLFGIYRREKKI